MDEVQDDVPAASKYVEGEVWRLLAGGCEAWEMVMTVCMLSLSPSGTVLMNPKPTELHRVSTLTLFALCIA